MNHNPSQNPEGVKPRLALLLSALGGGGAERQMLILASAIADRGYPVDLVVTQARGPLLAAVPDNVRLVDLCASRIITSLVPLVRYLRREQPTAMLTALAPVNCVAIWARALAQVSTHLVVSERNTLSHAVAGRSQRRVRLLPALMRQAYSKADAIVAVSEGVADDLAKMIGLPRQRIEVIYNPVITPSLLEKSREPIDHSWFAPGEPPVILGVGRLTRAKDFSTLIRAFALVRRERTARLLILGEGEERLNLEILVKELELDRDVSLPGFVSNPYAFMSRAKVFVLSSLWEGLPGVLIEAMACGAPVIATDCPSGPREILEDGRWGYLVSCGDHKALAIAMSEVLKGRGLPASSRAQCFSMNQSVKKYLSTILYKV